MWKLLIFYHRNYNNSKYCNLSWFQTFAMFWMFYAFFWVIHRRLYFECQRFWTLCLFHLHRRVGMKKYLPVYEDGRQSVPKCWHLYYRHRWITQKKVYKILQCLNHLLTPVCTASNWIKQDGYHTATVHTKLFNWQETDKTCKDLMLLE
jgi:hypothetical protein